MVYKIAILTTHPIQYYAPFFQLLAQEKAIDLKVFYSLGLPENTIDQGFGKKISWDLPLLSGYHFEFLTNIATVRGSHHFRGIKNPDVKRKIKEFGADLLLVYGWAYEGHLQAIRYFSKKMPIWFRGDSTLMNQQSSYKKLLRTLFLTWVYRHIDLALYVGTQNRSYYKAFGLKDQQLLFVPHSVDNARFSVDWSVAATRIRHKLGVDQDEILVLFAGKMETVKNPLLLISAFGGLSQPHVHLLMVGNGELEKEAKLLAESYNEVWKDRARIHLMSFQNQTQMPAIYQACDLFCLPSVSETWGLVINEAMASSKAVLVSDAVGCAIDLVKPDINGFTFKANNRVSLALKLKQMTVDKSRLKAMGIQSRHIIDQWSFAAQVTAIKYELGYA